MNMNNALGHEIIYKLLDNMEELRTLYNTPGAPQGAEGLRKMLKAQGVTLSLKAIREFLKEQTTQQVHKKRKLLNLNVQTTHEPFEVWESDILHLQRNIPGRQNNGSFYILVCVDKFTKMLFVEPLKKVDDPSVFAAMKAILTRCVGKYAMRPRKLVTDADTVFTSGRFAELMTEFVMEHRTVFMAYEAERAIKLIKEAISRALTHQGNKKWIDIIQPLTKTLNKREHRGLKMSPEAAVEKVDDARANLQGYWRKIKKKEPHIFSVGKHVLLREEKGTFAKGHVETFSHAVYKISHVFPPPDEFRSYRDGVKGIKNKVFTYNDLLKTTAAVTVAPNRTKPKDRFQKQAERELQDLDQPVIRKRLRSQKEVARKPRGDEVYTDLTERKKKR